MLRSNFDRNLKEQLLFSSFIGGGGSIDHEDNDNLLMMGYNIGRQ